MCWAYCTDNVKTAAQHVITLLTTLLRDESVSCNTGTTDRTVTPRFVTPCLLTFCSLKHSLHSDVILRPTIFSQRSSPERPESSLRRWRYINHLLTYLLTGHRLLSCLHLALSYIGLLLPPHSSNCHWNLCSHFFLKIKLAMQIHENHKCLSPYRHIDIDMQYPQFRILLRQTCWLSCWWPLSAS